MTVHCVVRKNNEETPVEIFIDVRSAVARFEELQAGGEEGLTIYATDI
jgi:hypothetical protein